MVSVCVGFEGMNCVTMESGCGALLKELQQIWAEIGENEAEKKSKLMEIERECLEVYRRKVDEASRTRAQLHQSIVAKEAEVASIMASLGELSLNSMKDTNMAAPLRDKIANVTPLLETLRLRREERVRQFSEIRSQIETIRSELSDSQQVTVSGSTVNDEQDFSVRTLNEYQAELKALQKEKSDRLQKVLEYVNQVHCLCGVLGLDFKETVHQVHPSLHRSGGPNQSTNISNSTIDGLSQMVLRLKDERKEKLQKLREMVEGLFKLWKLMDTSQEERARYAKLISIAQSSEDTITFSGALSQEMLDQAEAEVERLTKLKASRLKELVMKRRVELEDICKAAHIEPDSSTAPEKTNALIDSGLVDPSELLANLEAEIMKAREESMSRKDIMDRINKWLAACDEETWLEEYNKDDNRYSAGRGSHLNLRRAEKARILVTKIPAMVDNLIGRTFAWEDEKNTSFMYDGVCRPIKHLSVHFSYFFLRSIRKVYLGFMTNFQVRLVCLLEEYKLGRQEKEEEKRRFRDQKKLQSMLQTEKELRFGSKPTPKKSNSFNRRASGPHQGNGNGFMTPSPRRQSFYGGATPELLTPRSHSGRYNNFNKEMRRLSTAPLNFVAIPKEDSVSTFTSVSGSEPESPLHRNLML
ncbi:microtubule-associated protein 65-7 [Rhynchospora pubera]|uniref:Microtubule-associated protein 65-7 n=1 Tax=Rhynchospora pubera TaxID=906938 RepID=A0AAV8BV85_9POAL|nr:microtubule-associated protein 65-7 [Rhynchospora pubera]